MKRLSEEAIETLQSQLRGEVILPDDPDYDEARTIWNAMIDKRPGAIARCSGVADVMQALQVAKDHDLLLSVRSGGPQHHCLGVCRI